MPQNLPPISEEELAVKRPKRRIGCFMLGLIGLICLVATLFLLLTIWHLTASKRLNVAINQIKEAGHPTNEAELRATYQTSDGLNAGPLWVEAGNSFDQPAADIKKLPFIGVEADDPVMPGERWDQFEPSKAFLAQHADTLAKIAQASKATNPVRYDQQLVVRRPDDFNNSVPYMRSHRQICRVMAIACYVHAHQGNANEVANSINIGLRAGHSLSDEPKMIAQLLSTACTSMMTLQVRNFISLDFSDAQLQELQRTLRETNPQRSLVRGLEGEAVQGIENFKNPLMRGPIPRYEDAALYTEEISRMLEAASNGDWRDIRTTARAATRMVEELQQSPTGGVRYSLSGNAIPSLVVLTTAQTRKAAILLVTDTLIAARRFQIANGRLPNSLDELVPEFIPEKPLDPFSDHDEHLRLVNKNSGIIIYSRGVNTIDDGGSSEESQRGYLDIVAELESP